MRARACSTIWSSSGLDKGSLSLSELSRSLFDLLRGVAHHADTHFTELRQFGHVVLVDSLGIVRLDLDGLLKRSHADELLPSADGIVKNRFGIVHRQQGLDKPLLASLNDVLAASMPL